MKDIFVGIGIEIQKHTGGVVVYTEDMDTILPLPVAILMAESILAYGKAEWESQNGINRIISRSSNE